MPGLSPRNIKIVLGSRIPVLPVGFIILVCSALPAWGVLIETTWTGGTGNWNVAGNWSPAAVPNNGTDEYNVLIDGGITGTASVVSLDISPTITGFAIDSGDTLGINNATTLTLQSSGTYSNNGTLSLNSLGNQTNLVIGSITGGETLTIGGTGTISLSNNTNNRIYGAAGTNRLVLGSGQTLKGAGQIGVNLLALTNQGTIEATLSNSLTIDPSASV